MRTNVRQTSRLRTFEGAPAIPDRTPMDALRRAVSSCLLWEKEFYEDGVTIADRIADLASRVDPAELAALAVEVRTVMKLRHAALWLTLALVNRRVGSTIDVAGTIAEVCRRADEPGELLAMYWRNGRIPVPASMKRGLARAYARYDGYAVAKYDRSGTVRHRDVLRMVHPKPSNDEQSGVWKGVLDGSLASADTWEVALSGGGDAKTEFERLIREDRLGYMALLRNLRRMDQAGVDAKLVRSAILARKGAGLVLPFRFVAAARAAPRFERELDEALRASIADRPAFAGETIVLVDVSGSMDEKLSAKSDLTRLDAAATLASVVNGPVRVFTFSDRVVEVAPRRGMAGVEAIARSQPHHGTRLGEAVRQVSTHPHDRLIVITDEQSSDVVGAPKGRGYMINVASAKNGVGFGDWTRISGFSENVIRFIHASEADRP